MKLFRQAPVFFKRSGIDRKDVHCFQRPGLVQLKTLLSTIEQGSKLRVDIQVIEHLRNRFSEPDSHIPGAARYLLSKTRQRKLYRWWSRG
ncbi:MAG: hypothetical protein CSA20_01995 [Deltaproteobacteria bacterium]|nr:MAG: hypothetical protein CSA20_01995 [Deltaproteobacteria bacterium]